MKKIVSFLLSISFVFNAVPAFAATKLSFVTDPLWDGISYYSEDLMAVKIGDNTGFVDKKGETVIKPFNPLNKLSLPSASFQHAKYLLSQGEEFKVGNFHEGLAYISLGNSMYSMYIDKKGNTAYSTAELENILDGYTFPAKKNFSEGIAGGSPSQGNHRYVTRDGVNYEIKNPFDSMNGIRNSEYMTMLFTNGLFREGLTPAAFYSIDDELLFGYIDKDSNLVIKPKFQDAKPFNDGMAFVKYKDAWGVIDKSGKFIIQPLYSNYMVNDIDYENKSLKEGLFVVKKGEYWGAIDVNGRVVADFVWESMNMYSEGYAVVRKDNKYGYVNKHGSLVIPCKYTDANPFNNGIALVGDGGTYRFINTKGAPDSQETWELEASAVDPSDPELILYRTDGKWGLAKSETVN